MQIRACRFGLQDSGFKFTVQNHSYYRHNRSHFKGVNTQALCLERGFLYRSRISAELLHFLGYHVPRPLINSLVQTFKTIRWCKMTLGRLGPFDN